MCRSARRRSQTAAVVSAALLAAAAALPPCDAAATVARVLALGGQGGYLEDQSNVPLWYGSLVDYPDLVVLEAGRYDWRVVDQGAGLHWRLDTEGRWGTIAAYLLGDPEGRDRDERFAALWGREFGPLAAALSFSATSYANGGHEDFRHVLGAGLRWQAARRLYADVAAEALGSDFAYWAPAESVTVDRGSTWDGFGARARLFWGPSEQVAVIPLFEHVEDRRGTFSFDISDAAELDLRVDRLGLGLNLLPDPDRLIVVSVEFEDGRTDLVGAGRLGAYNSRWLRDWWSITGRFALETRALSWLTLRGGARYLRIDQTSERHRPARPDADPPVDASVLRHRLVDAAIELDLGLALHLGRFEADFVFNDEALFNFGGLVTNTENEGRSTPQFARVSMQYSW